METIRCLIAGIPHKLLSDIVCEISNNEIGLEVVRYVTNVEDISEFINDNTVDVIFLIIQEDKLSTICNELIKKIPDLVIVGLVDDGRRACIYSNDVGVSWLMNVIKTYKYTKKGLSFDSQQLIWELM